MSARVDEAKELAAEKVKEFQDEIPKDQLIVKPITDKVQSALDAYLWTVYVHIDKGVFKVPLSYLIAPGEDVPNNNDSNTPATDPLSQDNNAVDTVIQGNIDRPADLKFEHLDLALDNNSNGQGVVVQLGSFQVTGLDHPKLPSNIVLIPLQSADSEALPGGVSDVESLILRYKRKRQVEAGASTEEENHNDHFVTEVFARLQRMNVKIARKPNHPGFNTGSVGLPDMQAMVNRVVAMIQERKDSIQTIQDNVKQIELDVKWGVELGNCEVTLEEQDSTSGSVVLKPYGVIKLSDAVRPALVSSYQDLESRFVEAKFSIAENETQKDEKNTVLFEMQSALAKCEVDKHNAIAKLEADYQSLEMKLVEAKMKIVQIQEELDNYRSTRRK